MISSWTTTTFVGLRAVPLKISALWEALAWKTIGWWGFQDPPSATSVSKLCLWPEIHSFVTVRHCGWGISWAGLRHYRILSIFILLRQQMIFPINVRRSIEYVCGCAKMYVQIRTLKLIQRNQRKINLIEKKFRENYWFCGRIFNTSCSSEQVKPGFTNYLPRG